MKGGGFKTGQKVQGRKTKNRTKGAADGGLGLGFQAMVITMEFRGRGVRAWFSGLCEYYGVPRTGGSGLVLRPW